MLAIKSAVISFSASVTAMVGAMVRWWHVIYPRSFAPLKNMENKEMKEK